MDLRNRIKTLCKDSGISLNRLEQLCGFAKGYLSKLDKSVPNARNLQKIADFFFVSTDYLLGNAPNEYTDAHLYTDELGMDHLGDFLKQTREEQGLSLQELSQKTKISEKKLASFEDGSCIPKHNLLLKILDTYCMTLLDFEDAHGVMTYEARKEFNGDYNASLAFEKAVDEDRKREAQGELKRTLIPILGRVAAGVPIYAVEEILGYEEIPEKLANTGELFGLRIKGHSMEPRLCDGDVVIVRQQDHIQNGELAIVIINGDEGTCKKVMTNNDGITLISFNPAYPDMVFSAKEVQDLPIKICGKVIKAILNF